jgi:hypothetical protein
MGSWKRYHLQKPPQTSRVQRSRCIQQETWPTSKKLRQPSPKKKKGVRAFFYRRRFSGGGFESVLSYLASVLFLPALQIMLTYPTKFY